MIYEVRTSDIKPKWLPEVEKRVVAQENKILMPSEFSPLQ